MRPVKRAPAVANPKSQRRQSKSQRQRRISSAARVVRRLSAAQSIRQLAINTIRTLSMDAVQRANSGHPGTPMGLAPVAYTLWQEFLQFDPADPAWPNRDRFVLSNGHASMLLYSMLYLTGTKDAHGAPALTLDDIKRFRQIDSKTPGHPEYGRTAGIETTTGPLGQGCGNSVGMALASNWLARQFNQPNFSLFDYRVYAFCSDGDMMEGVASEAASLAGHLGLSNLCWLYDNNGISIEGKTKLAFSEDVGARFKAYGWKVHHLKDANDTEGLASLLTKFRKSDAPTLIVVDSHIGYGAPHKQDTSAAHGEPLGVDEVKLAKKSYGWPEDAQFLVPDGVREHFAEGIGKRGGERAKAWQELFAAYREKFPDLARQVDAIQRREPPDGWDAGIPAFPADAKGAATRELSGKVLNAIAPGYPWLIGGAADLAPSTKTDLKKADDLEADSAGGRNMHFGVREHAMGSVLNGMVLSGLRAFGATFLIFSDYMKPPIRLAALMELPVIYVFTHDSIGLGEDGPTHQPIEQLLALRSVPRLITLRPADANEVAEAYRVIGALTHNPAALVLSRQPLPTLDRSRYAAASGLARGAYVLADSERPEVILIGTGSEVHLCVESYEQLKADGIAARVVSMPSWELFEAQDAAYRDSVLRPDITARVSVEMGSTIGWDRYVLPGGTAIGMRGFGASAPLKDLLDKFGFTAEAVSMAARAQVRKSRGQGS